MRVPAQQRDFEEEWVMIGRIGAPYGVKGWNHVQSFCRPLDSILQYSPWYLQSRGEWVAVERQASRQHGDGLVIQLQGIETRDQAAALTQSMIGIRASQRVALPSDVFYWADLEGLTVELASGKEVGHIRHLYENAGIDVMIIDDGKGHEWHVPFIMHDTVLAVDMFKRCVQIDWCFDYPEG